MLSSLIGTVPLQLHQPGNIIALRLSVEEGFPDVQRIAVFVDFADLAAADVEHEVVATLLVDTATGSFPGLSGTVQMQSSVSRPTAAATLPFEMLSKSLMISCSLASFRICFLQGCCVHALF